MGSSSRRPIREIVPGIHLGLFPTGPLNSITDVPGVLVHTQSIRKPRTSDHHEINTGVTTILPRSNIWKNACHAGIFRFNGAGEVTGAHWLEESGILGCPIIISGTFAIGAAHEGVIRHVVREMKDANGLTPVFSLPVIAETWDGYLSDAGALPVRPEHVIRGIDEAHDRPVAQGNTGGGTGMICHGFKGGTGSASRKVLAPEGWKGKKHGEHYFHLGVLVQANYGSRELLRIGGVPVGLKFEQERKGSLKAAEPPTDGSIIIIIATDAPVLPLQLQRIAKRATVGLARVGGVGQNYSGDVFVAFSTAADIPAIGTEKDRTRAQLPDDMLNDSELDALFEATGDAVEESIYNALCMAETTTGPLGRRVEAINLERVKELVEPRLL